MKHLALAIVVFTLAACGGGGGGGGGGVEGWVEITEPTTEERYNLVVSDPANTLVTLAGNTFVSTNSTGGGCFIIPPFFWLPICTDPSSQSDVSILVTNESTCDGVGRISIGGVWENQVRITLGENPILVVAKDSSGNQGTDRITINVPSPPYVLPTHDISDQALSTRTCDQEEHPSDLSISTNANGDAAVTWKAERHIYAAIYEDGIGWLPTKMLSEENLNIYNPPKVAMDMDGNALVVWHGYTSLDTNCNDFIALDQCAVSRYYKKGVGWLQPEVIPDASVPQSSARDSRLIMDNQGNALLYWYDYDGGNYKDIVAQFNSVSGWGQRSETTVDFGVTKRFSHFISDGSDGARVVWSGYVGNASPKVVYSGFTWASGWSAPVELGDAGHINARGYEDSKPRIALSSSGSMVVAWTKEISGDSQSQLMANYFSPSSNWSGQTSIESDDSGGADHAAVGIDAAGNALVIWYQFDGANHVVRANQYIPGLGWGVEYNIGSNNPGNAVEPKLVMDSSGNATAIWMKYDGWTYSVVGNKYSAAMVWSGPEFIELNKGEGSKHPVVGAGKNGETIVAWAQYYDVWDTDSRFDPPWNVPRRTVIRAGVY